MRIVFSILIVILSIHFSLLGMSKKQNLCPFTKAIQEIENCSNSSPNILEDLKKIKRCGSKNLLSDNEVLSCVHMMHMLYQSSPQHSTYQGSFRNNIFSPAENFLLAQKKQINQELLLKSIILYYILYPQENIGCPNQDNLIPKGKHPVCILF